MIYRTCKGIYTREIANRFRENRRTDLRDIIEYTFAKVYIYIYIESLLWSPKKSRHLSESSIDHFRNTKHTDEPITDLIEIT